MDTNKKGINSNLLKVFRFYINMRKTSFIIYLLLLFSLTINAQIKVDSRIVDVYGEEYVNEVLINIPNKIQHLNYFLNNSYELKKLDVIESKKIPLISKYLRVFKHKEKNNYMPDLNNFNILMYDAPRDKNFKKVYRLDNTDYVIVFYSVEEFFRKMNNYYNK